MFLYAFEESVDCRLLSSFCDDSQTCDDSNLQKEKVVSFRSEMKNDIKLIASK